MIVPFLSIASSSTVTPRIQIYTTLVCNNLRPDYGESPLQQPDFVGFLHSNDCRIPALVHQQSCVDISDVFMVDKSLQTNGADTPPTRKQRCASDPVVQAAVAKLTTRAYRIYFFFVLYIQVYALCRQALGSPYLFIMWMMRFFLMTDLRLILVITASMGILSCITTVWWGAVSLTNHDI